MPRLNGHMPALTRCHHPERPDCSHVYYGDVQVGTIAVQPRTAGQRFCPPSHRGRDLAGYSSSFRQARDAFETAYPMHPHLTSTTIGASAPGGHGNMPCTMPISIA
jgi:hypothetical protein